jgi:hypothetical protein
MKTKDKDQIKDFDTVKTFRSIKDKISKELKDLSFEEIREYLKKKGAKLQTE